MHKPMKRILLTVVLAFLALVQLSATDGDMRRLIVAMPDSLLPLLTQVNREDCVDFLEAAMPARVTNRMGGTSKLLCLTDDYALWQYTEQSQVELKLLPMTDSTQVICLVHTILTPVADSSIRFFDTEWTALPTASFLTSATSVGNTQTILSTCFMKLSPDSLTLQIVCSEQRYEIAEEGDHVVPSSVESFFDWHSGWTPRPIEP